MKYGYALSAFRVRPHGGDPQPLGSFDGTTDALPILYGVLRGLAGQPVSERQRHLSVKSVEPAGRAVRFSVKVGNSGQRSEFYDRDDDQTVVFHRDDRHIEHTTLRGLLLAPADSTTGLLALEVQGRVGAKTLLGPALSKRFRHFSDGYILDIASVVDEEGLARLLAEAQAHQITLRRAGLPQDVADAVEMSAQDAETGKLELKITPGKIKQFQRSLVAKLRGEDDTARRRLLHVTGVDFDELSVVMTVGERSTTLTVTAERVPSFVYDLPGREKPDDSRFYGEVTRTINEISTAVGVVVRPEWDTGKWSGEALEARLTLPQEELIHATDGEQ
ncbi:hypothetical protein ABZ671_25315 [Micromonospora sp. NPDC006766]|uniref:hypothetical protein n=1 Tax=Micromonospora sp. NPDC006766 TaxID=3154778 RepID=UPI0033EDAAAB